EEKGLTAETADKIETFVKEKGPPLALLSKFRDGSAFLKDDVSIAALNNLEILFKLLDKSKRLDKVVFDLSLARGLDYYTGIIFEALQKIFLLVRILMFGSIASGGRYDNLMEMFGSKKVTTIGVSLGIERVFEIMEQRQKDQNQMARPTKIKVLVSILEMEDDLILVAELAGELWDAGHFEYANKSRIPWMVLVGEREVKEGVVQLKDLEGSNLVSIVEELRRRLYP
uniref:histidine--tRNA ligase n=1 Tax=Glycine max TaxID=3847 RepID=K7LK13_SOYBN